MLRPPTRTRIVGLAMAALTAVASAPHHGLLGAAAAGVLRGRVDIKRAQVVVEPRPSVSSVGTTGPQRAAESRPAVVYLESAPRGAFEREETRAVMNQQDQTFVPHVLAITAGTTVEFPNSDPYFHNVFSLSRTQPFDLGRYAAGRSKSVRFDRPGVVQVFCDIHSHMSAYILVFAHRYFAVTDAAGRYRIGNVPPGTYTLVAWHEGSVRDTRQVRVPDTGEPVETDFTVR